MKKQSTSAGVCKRMGIDLRAMDGILIFANIALAIVIALLVLYLRSLTSAYASKKGENLATHEDIEKIVDQVAAVTKTQEEIKASISDEVWSRQRQWELKREVLLNALEQVSQARIAVILVNSVYQVRQGKSSEELVPYMKLQDSAVDKYSIAGDLLEKAVIQVEAVCSTDMAKQLEDLAKIFRTVLHHVLDERNPGEVAKLTKIIKEHIPVLINLIRSELGVDKAASAS